MTGLAPLTIAYSKRVLNAVFEPKDLDGAFEAGQLGSAALGRVGSVGYTGAPAQVMREHVGRTRGTSPRHRR